VRREHETVVEDGAVPALHRSGDGGTGRDLSRKVLLVGQTD
jgi:hypothetical protein